MSHTGTTGYNYIKTMSVIDMAELYMVIRRLDMVHKFWQDVDYYYC